MAEDTTYVGLDTHLKKILVAMLPSGAEPVEWHVSNEPSSVRRLMRKLSEHRPIRICYEAGPLGYVLKRQFDTAGLPCMVVAPSLIPRRQGDRVKTDRRDARKLAELLRAGMLVEVHPPSEDEESVRNLWRCREDAQQDLVRARHRLGKFLLRRGLVFHDGFAGSQAHRSWLGNSSSSATPTALSSRTTCLPPSRWLLGEPTSISGSRRSVRLRRTAGRSVRCGASAASRQ